MLPGRAPLSGGSSSTRRLAQVEDAVATVTNHKAAWCLSSPGERAALARECARNAHKVRQRCRFGCRQVAEEQTARSLARTSLQVSVFPTPLQSSYLLTNWNGVSPSVLVGLQRVYDESNQSLHVHTVWR